MSKRSSLSPQPLGHPSAGARRASSSSSLSLRTPTTDVPELKRAKETLTRRLGAQQAAVHQREAQFASLQAQRDAMGLPKIDAETLASTEETDSEGGDMHALRDAWTAVTASRAACRKTEKQLASVDERLQHSTHSPWELYCMVRDLTQEVQHLQEELRDLRDRDRDRSVPHTCVQCSPQHVRGLSSPAASGTTEQSWSATSSSIDAVGLLNDWSAWILGYYTRKTVRYAGLVMWMQDATQDSDERQDEIMNEACTRAYGDTARAATAEEYRAKLIDGLPFKNQTQLCIIFPGERTEGVYDPRLVSGHCRKGVHALAYLDGTLTAQELYKGQRLCIAVLPVELT